MNLYQLDIDGEVFKLLYLIIYEEEDHFKIEMDSYHDWYIKIGLNLKFKN